MPMLAEPNEHVIPVTMKCNWDCSYCAVRNSKDQKCCTDDDVVLAKCQAVPAGATVTLTGGEPGMASYELLEQCVSILERKKCKLFLETNGLAVQRWPSLCKRFHTVMWHCSKDLDACKIPEVPGIDVRWLIIVHDGNFHKLEQFLACNPDVKFDAIAATYPYREEVTGPTLSEHNKHSLLAKFCHRLTRESVKRLLHEKEFNRINWMF